MLLTMDAVSRSTMFHLIFSLFLFLKLFFKIFVLEIIIGFIATVFFKFQTAIFLSNSNFFQISLYTFGVVSYCRNQVQNNIIAHKLICHTEPGVGLSRIKGVTKF